MPTFRVSSDELKSDRLVLSGEPARHLSRVLRAQVGEVVRLTDGKSKIVEGKITHIDRDVQIQVTRELKSPAAPHPVHLFISLLKREKLEFLVEKAVELNIQAVHFVISKRSVRSEISGPKWDRLLKIAESALTQCGRIVPIELHEPVSFSQAVSGASGFKNYWFYEREENATLKGKTSNHPVGIWIGPEGGWDEAETQAALQAGFESLSLGSLILRAETAALHAISSVLTTL